MAFDRRQSSLATFQPQASVKFSNGKNGGGVWPLCMPSASLQKQDTASHTSWSSSVKDEPSSLISPGPNGWINRKLTDLNDSDVETDLQGLVSNILDEVGSQNGYNGRDIPASNSIWSPKTMSDELRQCFQSESKNEDITTFRPNYGACVTSNTVNMDDNGVFQQTKEPDMSQTWLFNIPNGDKDYLNYRPTNLPPGLLMPNADYAYRSQIKQERHESTAVSEKRGSKNYLNSFPDLGNGFPSQSETTNLFLLSHCEDNGHNSAKPIGNEQYVSQDPNQLVTAFQSFMASKYDSSFHGSSADIYRETQSRHNEDWMEENWKFTSPSMPTQITPAVQAQKEMVGVHMERNGVMRNKMVNCDNIQDLHGFSPPNSDHFQQPKMLSGSVSLNNHYQTKMTMQKKNTLLPFNLKNNQCLNQQDHIQSKIKSQMPKEKKISGIHGENLYTSHITNCSTKVGERNQQNLDHFGIMQSQRLGGDNSRVGAKNGQQFMSCVYPVNDPKKHLSMNSSNYHPRSTLSYGSPALSESMGNLSANEFTTFKAVVNDLMTQRGDPTYHGVNSAMTTSVVMDDVPVVQLYFYLDECCDQLRCLEKERKKTEIILAKAIQGGKTAANTSTFLPKIPPNPTKIDHLIVGQMKEQAKVASVLHRMESLNGFLHTNIHTALKKHYMAISVTEARRKEEIAIMSKQQQQRDYFADYKDILLMVMALKDLTVTTRRFRTALWCALQIVLPKPVKSQDQATDTERCPSPYQGGSYKL